MSITGSIIKKELREMSRERIIRISGISLVLLLFFSLVMSVAYNKAINRQISAANELSRDLWEAQGPKNQHSAAHYGVYLFKPRAANAFWDHGIDKFVGSSLLIEPHGRNRSEFKPAEDSPLIAKWGELSPAFVMLVLLPLLIIWLCAGSVAKERESRTLHFALSQGIDWRKLLFAKALSRWIIVGALAIPAMIVMGIVLYMTTGGGGFDLISFFMLALSYLLFLGVFIQLGVALSARLRSTAATTIAMLGFWLCVVWIIPRVAAEASEAVVETGSGWAFDQTLDGDIAANGIKRHDQSNPQTRKFTEATLKKYGVDKVEDLPVNFNGLILQESEEFNDVIIDQAYDNLYAGYRQQAGVMQYFGLISPFISAKQLSMGLCQTDLLSYLHFDSEANRYRKEFNRSLNTDLINSGPMSSERVVREETFWKEVPGFEYQTISRTEILRNYAPSILLLTGWFIFSGLFLFTAKPKLSQ